MTFAFKTATGDVITFRTETGGDEFTRISFERQPQEQDDASLDDSEE